MSYCIKMDSSRSKVYSNVEIPRRIQAGWWTRSFESISWLITKTASAKISWVKVFLKGLNERDKEWLELSRFHVDCSIVKVSKSSEALRNVCFGIELEYMFRILSELTVIRQRRSSSFLDLTLKLKFFIQFHISWSNVYRTAETLLGRFVAHSFTYTVLLRYRVF